MSRTFATLSLCVATLAAIIIAAPGVTTAAVPVFHGFDSHFVCADGSPVAAFAYQLTNPLGTQTGTVDLICESTDTGACPYPSAGVAGDERAVVAFDWASPGVSGNPITPAGPHRIAILAQAVDGRGLIVSLSGANRDYGYLVELAHRYNPSDPANPILPLPCTVEGGAPDILEQNSAGGLLTAVLHFQSPPVFSDCDPDSVSVAAGLGACVDQFRPATAPARVFTRLGPCTTAPPLGIAAWSDSGIVPDSLGVATVTAPEPGWGECLFIGGTATLDGMESGGITGFVAFPGRPCIDADGDGVGDCQGDCDDNDPRRSPHLPEVCDDIDNDCDGVPDDGLVCQGSCHPAQAAGPATQVSSSPAGASSATFASTGSGYGVAWMDFRTGHPEVFFARLDGTGHKVGEDQKVPGAGATSNAPSIVWTGSAFGIAWADNRDGNFEIYFRILGPDGTAIGGERRVTSAPQNSSDPSLVWTGGGFGVAWTDYRDGGNGEIYFARLDASGARIGADVRITDQPNNSNGPSLVWTGSGFGVAFLDDRDLGGGDVYFARISDSGAEIGEETRVSVAGGAGFGPSLIWDGTGYGVAWGEQPALAERHIRFARLDAPGTRLGEVIQVDGGPGPANEPSLAWNGLEYGVLWPDRRDGAWTLFFRGLTAAGQPIGGDTRITSDATTALAGPALAWVGDRYAAAWSDNRALISQVYFSAIACNCHDADGDGHSSCDDCDDGRADVFPGAPEICDGSDNDCDALVDEGGSGTDRDGDGIPEACDSCPLVPNPGQDDFDFDGHGDLCDVCPTIPNADQDPGACDQRVVDIAVEFTSPYGHGSGVLFWTTTHEVDVRGYNVVVYDPQGRRVQQNPVLIACEACTTGEPAGYAVPVPKHKSGRNIFVELLRRDGTVETWGPATRR
jgi:hypothetical protein